MNRAYAYRFITNWQIKASIDEVWDIIHEQVDWPNWWKGVVKVETIKEGGTNNIRKVMPYTWKSFLPYTLAFYMVSDEIEKPHIPAGTAFGELDGKGRGEMYQDGDLTTLNYHWHINTIKPWMNKQGWLLKPAFKIEP
ncbi:MAG: polyketide cyclase [Bacteroidota bacterium]